MTSGIPASMLIHSVTWIVPTTSTDAYGNTTRTYGSGTTISSGSTRCETPVRARWVRSFASCS